MDRDQNKNLTLLSPADGLARGLSRELIHAWNQLVFQQRFPGTPAGFQSQEQKEQAIAQWHERCQAYRKSHAYVLQFSELPSCDFFVGRGEELTAIETAFSGGDGQAKLVIHGMGGIGKTTLARQAVERLKDRYDKILWLTYRMDLLHTVCDDAQLNIQNLRWSFERCSNQKEYFREKWSVLSQLLEQERVLVVLDDMNNPKDRRISMIWELPCDVLVTSRIFRPEWRAVKLPLEALQNEEEWQSFYEGYNPGVLAPSRVEQLRAYRGTVQGNTLLMRLAVRNSDLSQTMEAGLESYFLRTNALNATDVQVLRYLALLPVSGMELPLFLSASALKEEALRKLMEMSLVWMGDRGGIRSCGLHPVIAASVYRAYQPTPENCSRFLSGLAACYADIWNRPYAEVLKALPICTALLGAWPCLRAWLADTYDAFATVLWIGGYFDESLHYMMKLYQACVAYYGEIHQMTASVALRVGAVYHNSLRFDQAKQWYQKAFEILQNSEPYNVEYHHRVMSASFKLARAERHEGNCNLAMEYLSAAERAMAQYREKKGGGASFVKEELWFLVLEKAKIFYSLGNLEEALTLCETIEGDYRREFPDRYHLLVELHVFQAELELKQGAVSKALCLAEDCTKVCREMRGDNAKETLSCQEILADACLAAGEIDKAMELYRDVLDKLSRHYPLQKAWYTNILRKESAVLRGAGEYR